jgi:hypothetical protein
MSSAVRHIYYVKFVTSKAGRSVCPGEKVTDPRQLTTK